MDLRYYFVLGSKLIGFYCLVLTIMHFVPLVLSIFDTSEYSSEQFEYGKIVFVFSMLTPILLAVIGVYLIKDGSLVHELAFRNGGAPTSRSSELFTMSIKVYGLYLAAVNIPDFFELLANRILVGHLPYDLGKYVRLILKLICYRSLLILENTYWNRLILKLICYRSLL